MPTKEETLNSLDKGQYSQHEVRMLVQEMRVPGVPTFLKKGDLYTTKIGVGKPRPVVIISIVDDVTLGMALTSNECTITIPLRYGDRFRPEGSWFTYGIITTPISAALDNYIGRLENIRILNKAIKLNKEFLINNL